MATKAPSGVFGAGTLLGIGMLDKSDLFPPPPLGVNPVSG